MHKLDLHQKLKFYFLGIVVLCTMIVGGFATNEYSHAGEHMRKLLLQEARIFCNRDLVLRRWVTSHRGIYAEIDANTPPNHELANIPERDIITPTGRKLTLLNPAYVLRQISGQFSLEYGTIDHITSLTPYDSRNIAAPWEQQALRAFEDGAEEFILLPESENETYFRFMIPLFIEKGCLHCHIQQGFKEGSIGGGVSVSILMAPFLENKKKDWASHRNKLLFFYLLGSSAIFLAYLFSAKRARKFTTVQLLLRESELKYRTLFTNTPEAIYWVASDASFINVNHVATAILGYSQEELLTMKVMDINPGINEDDWPSIWQRLQTGKTFRREGNHRKKDGSLVPIHITSNLVQHGVEEYACSIVRDISSEKKAAEQLLTSNRRWHAIFQESPISLWEEDLSPIKRRIDQLQEQGVEDFQTYFEQHPYLISEFASLVKIINVNKATLSMYKANSPTDLLKGLPSIFTQESLNVFRDGILSLIQGKTNFEADAVNMTLTGEKLFIIVKWQMPAEHNNDWSHIIVSIQDITLRIQAEEKSRENLSKLAHAGRLTALGEMANGVAHELNQPLHIISLITEYMEENIASNDSNELTTSLRDIKEQVWRASKIITKMRIFAQPSEESKNWTTFIEVEEPIRMALSFFTAQFRNHGIKLSLQASQNLPQIQADPQKLEQIIINLLTNARHAVEYKMEQLSKKQSTILTPPYLMQVEVRIWGDPQKKLFFIEVQDNGIGMDKETTDHCLEPFFSRKDPGKGSGLGLSIVHNLTTELRGEVTVTSQLKLMTKIQISLPGVF